MRYNLFFTVLIISALLVAAPAHSEENKFKLKKGAKGALCLKCHETFQAKLEKQSVHTPVKIGECSGCHNPHTSPHGQLLDAAGDKICFDCHKKMMVEDARSSHKVVIEGNCVKCHDPHASGNKFVLLKAGNELCFDCHKDVNDKLKKIRFRHKPVNENCISCHNPHSSEKFDYLLKNDIPPLCLECHKTDKPAFKRQHSNYPVADSKCNKCHDSHGSNKPVILFDDVHEPVAKKKCNECHQEPGSQFPIATKKEGVELCRVCHNDMIEETFDKNRVHWPLVDNTGCLNCHNAHAAKQKKLLRGSVISVCGTCHSDTVELQEISKNNPKNTTLCKPIREGNCISCHSPHASDTVLLAAKPSMSFDVCGSCHEWQSHSTHPLGEKVVDQRNKNLTVDCMSCHRACGTGNNPKMSQFKTVTETCVQCHEELRR
jgi:DmsE family decaheme c-type cytochrome